MERPAKHKGKRGGGGKVRGGRAHGAALAQTHVCSPTLASVPVPRCLKAPWILCPQEGERQFLGTRRTRLLSPRAGCILSGDCWPAQALLRSPEQHKAWVAPTVGSQSRTVSLSACLPVPVSLLLLPLPGGSVFIPHSFRVLPEHPVHAGLGGTCQARGGGAGHTSGCPVTSMDTLRTPCLRFLRRALGVLTDSSVWEERSGVWLVSRELPAGRREQRHSCPAGDRPCVSTPALGSRDCSFCKQRLSPYCALTQSQNSCGHDPVELGE